MIKKLQNVVTFKRGSGALAVGEKVMNSRAVNDRKKLKLNMCLMRAKKVVS